MVNTIPTIYLFWFGCSCVVIKWHKLITMAQIITFSHSLNILISHSITFFYTHLSCTKERKFFNLIYAINLLNRNLNFLLIPNNKLNNEKCHSIRSYFSLLSNLTYPFILIYSPRISEIIIPKVLRWLRYIQFHYHIIDLQRFERAFNFGNLDFINQLAHILHVSLIHKQHWTFK